MNIKTSLSVASACILLLTFSTISNAALLTRLGGLAVYDTDQNIIWLTDGNAAAGSAFDDGALPNDGLMTWANANAWAASLTVGGGTWRLPSAFNSDGTICPGGTYNCTDSEMGHLFYLELGGAAGVPILNSTDPDVDLFTDIQTFFWLETALNDTLSYGFSFGPANAGIQTFGGTATSNLSVLAVHDGDIDAVPVPAATWLFGFGLIGLIGVARRKK